MTATTWTQDNTEGYTQAELDALNAELAARLTGLDPMIDIYEAEQIAQAHADEVARRMDQRAGNGGADHG